jgi:hypothetical protein
MSKRTTKRRPDPTPQEIAARAAAIKAARLAEKELLEGSPPPRERPAYCPRVDSVGAV